MPLSGVSGNHPSHSIPSENSRGKKRAKMNAKSSHLAAEIFKKSPQKNSLRCSSPSLTDLFEPLDLKETHKLTRCNSKEELERSKENEIAKNLKNLEDIYHLWNSYLNKIKTPLKSVLNNIEYVKANEDNILGFLSKTLTPEQFRLIEEEFKKGKANFQWFDCLAPLIVGILQKSLISDRQSELQKTHKNFSKCRHSFPMSSEDRSGKKKKVVQSNSQTFLDNKKNIRRLRQKFALQKQIANETIESKLTKCIGNILAVFLEKIIKYPLKIATKISKSSFFIVRDLRGTSALFKIFTLQKETTSYFQPRILVRAQPKLPTKREIKIRKKLYKKIQNTSNLKLRKKLYKKFRVTKNNPPLSKEELIFKRRQKKLIEDTHQFISDLENCHNLKEVKKIFDKLRITTEIPLDFDEWNEMFKNDRFKRQLIQTFYFSKQSRPILSQKDILDNILVKKQIELEWSIKKALPIILNFIRDSKELEIDDLKSFFKKRNICLDKEPFSIQSREQWDNLITNHNFCRLLAREWVQYQETAGILAMQGLRQLLTCKAKVEGSFLKFRLSEYIVSITSSILQLAICLLPIFKLLSFTSILEFIISDLTKSGIAGFSLINILYPLFPGMYFRLDRISMKFAENIFGRYHKSHTYALSSYLSTLKIKLLDIFSTFASFMSFFEQFLLWMKIQMVDRCLLRRPKIKFSEDKRAIRINLRYKKKVDVARNKIALIKLDLKKLEVKDLKTTFSSSIKPKKMFKFDPITTLVKDLQKKNIDFDYFSPTVREFFEDNIGLKLTKDNKPHLQTKIEQLMSSKEEDFIYLQLINRNSHLKTP